MSTKIQEMLKNLVKKPEQLVLLRESPEKLADEYKLNEDELNALKSADFLLVSRPHNPLANSSTLRITFVTGTTITAGLDFLKRDDLIRILKYAVHDADYAARVRAALWE